MTDAQSAPTNELLVPPSDLSSDEYEGVLNAISHNIEQGLGDPLNGISDQTEVDLVRLAFNDPVRLDRLERAIKGKIELAKHGSVAVAKFNLASYRKGAKHIRDKIAAARARRQKLAARGMRVIDGSKGNERLEGLSENGTITDQADEYSSAPHLQASAWIRINRKGRIWYDEFHNNFFSDWNGSQDDRVIPAKAIDDAFLISLYTTILRENTSLAKSSYGNSERALHAVGFEDRRNEPKEWLKGLQWDGVARLGGMLSQAYGCPDDDYHRAVGRCWFVSMAARIMQAGAKVHTMPVFVGDQGYLKSTALEIIGGKWYGIINVGADKQNDFVGAMAGLVVAEIAELDAISGRRVENSRVKTLLSTSEDRYRPPYGRTTQVFKRTAVLAGTTNDSGWHRDETGARRFWTVMCRRPIDIEWLRLNRDQLFAEALHRLNENESWWDVPRAEQERLAMEHFASDPWEERIEQALATYPVYSGSPDSKVKATEGDPSAMDMDVHWGTVVTTSRIMTQWLQLPMSQQGHRTSLQVARVMKKLGWISRTVRVNPKRTRQAWTVCSDQGSMNVDTGQKELPINELGGK